MSLRTSSVQFKQDKWQGEALLAWGVIVGNNSGRTGWTSSLKKAIELNLRRSIEVIAFATTFFWNLAWVFLTWINRFLGRQSRDNSKL